MDARLIDRIESSAERGAAALLAAAMAYAAYGLLTVTGLQTQLSLCAAAAGASAYLPCQMMLRAASDGSTRFTLPDFTLREFEFPEAAEELLLTDSFASAKELLLTERLVAEELFLTDADRVDPTAARGDDQPLVLDDILAEIGPDARVVRLFDRKAMPAPKLTPGQLQSRIADHLADGAPRFAPSNPPTAPDASQALSDALAELRRSLR